MAFFRRARFRLTLYFTGIQLVVLILFGTFLYSQNERSMMSELVKFVRDDTRDLMVAVHDQKDDWAGIQRRLDFESRGERAYELSFRLLDPSGKVLACSRTFREAAITPISEEELHDALEGESREEIVQLPGRPFQHLLVTRASADPETSVIRYVVQTLAYLEPLDKLGRRFRRNAYSAIPIFVLITWFAGYALARKVLKPVNQIARTARQITSSSLHERLVRSHSGDEFDMLASTLNEMIRRLEESFALTRQFAADAAHELRTPLTIMRGEAEVALRSNSRDAQTYRAVLESTLREYDRMIGIITQLLLLSQADAGAVHVQREAVRLDRLLAEVGEVFHVLAEEAQLALHVAPMPEITVQGDRVRLHELFANLLDNAVKYTAPGGRVSVECVAGPDDVRVAVSDTGIGIPAEQQEKIFQRFYRVENSRSRETGGAGLGLSIARWIARAHGGRIEVQSTPGVGSTFTVVLPLPVAEESQAATEPAPPAAASPGQGAAAGAGASGGQGGPT